jgi:pyruvate dehydrogenase E1 component beta subunit
MSIRKLTFSEAINEALLFSMKKDKGVLILGCGVTSPTAIFGSVKNLYRKFGKDRVIETPIAENGITGIATGASLFGMRPVIVHQRIDFMLLAMDQIINHAAKWSYMFGGKCGVPITIRCIIGKGWGQGAQHSQSLQALFAHIPGLKVVMPSTPYDAKGLLIASIEDKNPVIFIEHRRLYDYRESVPQGIYRIPLGKGRIIKVGKDVTIVASSLMVQEAIKSAAILKKDYKIDAEILDLRCLKPLDKKLILNSVRKTKRLIVADNGWKEYGVSAEISALVAEFCYPSLKAPIKRIALPTAATPTSVYLENLYYPNVANIVKVTRDLINGRNTPLKPIRTYRDDSQFKGPF